MLNHDQHRDFNALLPGKTTEAGATRRTALKTALGVGYAASTMPIMAQTAIKTPTTGLKTGEGVFEVANFPVPFFFAAPEGKKNLPVILVVQEIFGVHEYIADTCRRFANAGYLAIAPELYARQGDPGSYGEIAMLLTEVVAKVPDAQVMADLDGAVQWAVANGGHLRKVGITGFCWGARITWLYAEQSTHVKAAAALASRFVVYPQAPHAFHADYRPSYRKEAAEDGFQRALAWFKGHGVG